MRVSERAKKVFFIAIVLKRAKKIVHRSIVQKVRIPYP